MTGFNGRELGARVAGLLQGQFKGDLVSAARDVNVDPDALRRIVEARTNTPDWRGHMSVLEDEDDLRTPGNQVLLRLRERQEHGTPADRARRIG